MTRTKKLLGVIGIAGLALTGCSAEEMEAYQAEQEEQEETETTADAEMVEVPDVVGEVLSDAEDTLDDLDLDVDEYDTSEDEKSVWNSSNWEVVEQDPASGEQVEVDTEVLLGVLAIEDEDDDAGDEDADEEEEAAEDDKSPVEPTSPEHAVALATGDDEAQADLTPGESGEVLFVQFDIGDNFTSGLMISGAQRATFDALEELSSSDIEYSRVFVQGHLPMQDQYGNVENDMVLNAGYDADTVDQINFENITIHDTIWELRDTGMVHPELQE